MIKLISPRRNGLGTNSARLHLGDGPSITLGSHQKRVNASHVLQMELLGALGMATTVGNLLKYMVGPWGLEPQTSTVSR